MRNPLILLLLILVGSTQTSFGQIEKAQTTKAKRSQTTSVNAIFNGNVAVYWMVLTTAENYPKWNTTITSLEGEIAAGKKIKLKSTLDEKRTFKLKILEYEENKKLVWGDRKGKRTFSLTQVVDGHVNFHMEETIGGFMYPMYAKYLPSFDESFEQFARDLQKEVYRISGISE